MDGDVLFIHFVCLFGAREWGHLFPPIKEHTNFIYTNVNHCRPWTIIGLTL